MPVPSLLPLLQGSADEHSLESDTSERLQLGLMGLSAAALGVHIAHGEPGFTRQGLALGGWRAAAANQCRQRMQILPGWLAGWLRGSCLLWLCQSCVNPPACLAACLQART